MSRIRANQITNQSADGAPTVQNGLVISGVTTSTNVSVASSVTATTYYGSGANLTGIDTDLVSDTSPQLGADLDCNQKGILLQDRNSGNQGAVKWGDNGEMWMFHAGSDNTNRIYSSGKEWAIWSGASNDHACLKVTASNTDPAIELYYNNSKKLETTNTGVTVTGTVAATAFTGDGSALTGTGVGGNTNVNTTGIITATAFVPTNQNLSHRNKIINGSQKIFQRGTSEIRSGGNDGYYNGLGDRWAIRMHSSVAQTTFSQDTSDNPHGFGSNQKSVRANAGSSNVGKYFVYDTKLEGQDLQDFAKGTSSAKEFTLSFYVKTGVSGVYCVEMRDLDNSRMVGGTYTVSNGNWNRYVITFPADTTGAFGNDNNASLWVRFWLAAGSNFTSGTARTAWAAGAPDSVLAVGQTAQVGDNVADTWQITGVQLEVGPVATPFEHRSFGDELPRCQRYFQRLGGVSNYHVIASGFIRETTQTFVQGYFTTRMRASPGAPTMNGSPITTDRYHFDQTITSIDSSQSKYSVDGFHMRLGHSAVGAEHRPVFLCSNSSGGGSFDFSAEL